MTKLFTAAVLAIAALALTGGETARAVSTIEPLHWYRMGDALEIDPTGQPMISQGIAVPALHDSLNGAELQAIGPAGTIMSTAVPTEQDVGFLTQRNLLIFDTSKGYTGEVLTTGADDFEFEGWLTLSSGILPRTMCVACNGTPGVDGWSIYLEKAGPGDSGRFVVRYGPKMVAFSPIPLFIQTPIQFAVVHSKVDGEYVVFNGQTTQLSPVAFTAPTGHFTLGACPDGTGGYKDTYYGNLDEIRFSRVLQLDPLDRLPLLRSAPDIRVSAGVKVLSHSGEVDLGSLGTGGRKSLSIVASKSSLGTSSGALAISGMTLDGPDAAEFQLSPSASSTPAFFSGSLDFRPTTPGPKTATLTIASNDPDDSRLKITYHATVFAAPDIAVFTGSDPATGNPVDSGADQALPSAAPGATGAETLFSIRNTGLADLHLSPVSLKGNDQGAFFISRQPEASLAPGAATVVGVRFRPTTGGTRQAYVALTSDAANNPSFFLSVTATAPGPILQVNGPDGAALASRAVRAWGLNGPELDATPPGLGAVKSIASGAGFAAAVRMDGSVAVWGSVGLATPTGLTDVTQIVAAGTGLLAMKSDGTVIGWGYANAPVNVPAGLSGVTALAANDSFALALKSDGTVTGWSAYATDTAHQPPTGLTGVTAISVGSGHAIALRNDGTIVTWGNSVNAPPSGLDHVVAIEATSNGGLALRADGSIVNWSDDSGTGSPFPDTGSPVVALGKGDIVATAIRADGTIALAGGTNPYGELGEPAFPHRALDLQTTTNDVLELYDSRIDLSAADPGRTGIPQTITLTNRGEAVLHLNGAALGGSGAAGYLLDTSEMATALAPGETTALTVALAPGSDGAQEATLEIASDDPGHAAFTVSLAGRAQAINSPYNQWKSVYFPAGGATAADLADPNGNGIPNLLEYALGGDPVAMQTASTSVLPQLTADGSGGFTCKFSLAATKTDLVVTVQGSDGLAADGWTDLARSTGGGALRLLVPGLISSSSTSQGIYRYNLFPSTIVPMTAPHRFLRLKVATR